MTAGISTACFYPQYTEETLSELVKHSVAATEVFVNSSSEMRPSFLKELRRIADSGGTRILSVHPFTSGMEPMLFFSRYDRRYQDGRDFYKRYCEAANLLGAKVVAFHGNHRGSNLTAGEYAECFGPLVEDAWSQGISLCHENVCRCVGYEPAFFQQLSRFLPDAGYVLDIKQAVRSGRSVFEFIQAMGTSIKHIHISDHDDRNDCLCPGKGTFNIREFLSQLDLLGYDGGVIVELYRENFKDIVEILSGYQHLCACFSTMPKK